MFIVLMHLCWLLDIIIVWQFGNAATRRIVHRKPIPSVVLPCQSKFSRAGEKEALETCVFTYAAASGSSVRLCHCRSSYWFPESLSYLAGPLTK
jgi:hypothetical protein